MVWLHQKHLLKETEISLSISKFLFFFQMIAKKRWTLISVKQEVAGNLCVKGQRNLASCSVEHNFQDWIRFLHHRNDIIVDRVILQSYGTSVREKIILHSVHIARRKIFHTKQGQIYHNCIVVCNRVKHSETWVQYFVNSPRWTALVMLSCNTIFWEKHQKMKCHSRVLPGEHRSTFTPSARTGFSQQICCFIFVKTKKPSQ